MTNEVEIFAFVGLLPSTKDTILDFQKRYKLEENHKKRNRAVDDSFGKQQIDKYPVFRL